MSRIGSNTNSNDPMMIKSRVFVGNIDSRLSREELEIIFGKYGAISALSMHKGYGFVQFTDEISARAAVFGENNKQYYSKPLDCNVASEPKSNRKRLPQHQQHVSSPSNTWQSQSYSSVNNPYLAATAHALAVQAQSAAAAAVAAANSANASGSMAKRPRLQGNMDHSSSSRKTSNLVSLVSATPPQPVTPVVKPLVVPPSKDVKDILICGNCKESFNSYERFINHKAVGCRLRFICRCKQLGEPRSLTCIKCGVCVQSSWELLKHHVTDHNGSFFVGEQRFFATEPEETTEGSSKEKASPADTSKEKSNGDKKSGDNDNDEIPDENDSGPLKAEEPIEENLVAIDEDEVDEQENDDDGAGALGDSPGGLLLEEEKLDSPTAEVGEQQDETVDGDGDVN